MFKGAFSEDRHPFSSISPDFRSGLNVKAHIHKPILKRLTIRRFKPIQSKGHGQLNPNPGQLSQEISRVKGKPSRRKEKANQKLIAYFVKVNEQRLPGRKDYLPLFNFLFIQQKK